MSSNNFAKLRLLLWKDWILQWNHKIQLIVEIALPAAFSLILLLIRSLSNPYKNDVLIYNETFSVNSLDYFKQNLYFLHQNFTYHLAFSPTSNTIYETIAQKAAGSLNLSYSGYANSNDLQNAMLEKRFFAGVEFDQSMEQDSTKLNYRIRFPNELRKSYSSYYHLTWLTNNLYMTSQYIGPRNRWAADGGTPVGYVEEGFLAIQSAVSMAFLNLSSPKLAASLPEVFLRRYPYPEYYDDGMIDVISIMLPIVVFISYMYSSTWLIKFITAEKEKQLKEVMKMMGLQNWLHWTAWFLQAFLAMGISTLLVVIILTVSYCTQSILIHSSFTAVLFFFLVYTAATVTFCLMVATFFSKANTAASVSSLIWFVTFVPYLYFSGLTLVLNKNRRVNWNRIRKPRN